MYLFTERVPRPCSSLPEGLGAGATVRHHGHHPFGRTNSLQGNCEETGARYMRSVRLRVVTATVQGVRAARGAEPRTAEARHWQKVAGSTHDSRTGTRLGASATRESPSGEE